MSAYSDLMFRENCTVHYFTQADRSRGGQVKRDGVRLRNEVLRKLKTREMRPSDVHRLRFERHYRHIRVGKMVRALAGRRYEFELASLNAQLSKAHPIRPEKRIHEVGPKAWRLIMARWG